MAVAVRFWTDTFCARYLRHPADSVVVAKGSTGQTSIITIVKGLVELSHATCRIYQSRNNSLKMIIRYSL